MCFVKSGLYLREKPDTVIVYCYVALETNEKMTKAIWVLNSSDLCLFIIIGDWLMIMRLMLCTYCEKNHLSLGFGGMTALWKHNVNVNEFIRVFTWTWISCLSSLKGFFLTAFSVRLLQSVMQHLMLDLITFWVRMTNISLYSLIFVMIQNTVFLWFLSYWARNQMNMNCLSYPAHD